VTGWVVDQSLTVAQYTLNARLRSVRLPITAPLGVFMISLELFLGGVGGGFRVSSGEVAHAIAGATQLMGLRTGEGTGRARIKNTTIEKMQRTIVRLDLSEERKFIVAAFLPDVAWRGRPLPATRWRVGRRECSTHHTMTRIADHLSNCNDGGS
jgi:hypothetical protein